METIDLIPADEFCTHHHVSYTFIATLQEAGLAEVTVVSERNFLQAAQLKEIEKLVRLHNELGINLEGVETIAHMLKRMEAMQEQLKILQQRLRFYEDKERPENQV